MTVLNASEVGQDPPNTRRLHLGETILRKNSLNPRARKSEGIVGMRAPHVRPNLGLGEDWSERVTDETSSSAANTLYPAP
ncbi:jg20276 [Pararge aegeria aegeria]|uniref:Jg20276 protein n=1 Tax=Pararge aegeria aegeria TaxID=348720 RepID=A0A8S4R738_9NEOP|nr:jg20276 [Pararge aegeria aegeria]